MKILLMMDRFDYISGSPMFNYELAREFRNMGHEVGICALLGGIMSAEAEKIGIKLHEIKDFPYCMEGFNYDVVFTNQIEPSCLAVEGLDIPVFHIVHSELVFERPYLSDKVRKYIAVKPSVYDKCIRDYKIDEERLVLIYNPIDFSRFNKDGAIMPNQKTVLFVGTVDNLRKNAAMDVINKVKNEGGKVIFVGKKFADWLENIKDESIEYIEEMWNIEALTKICTETAGVMYGRYAIEGWACGKPSTIYIVDNNGNVLEKIREEVPSDMSIYDSKFVAKQFLDLITNGSL